MPNRVHELLDAHRLRGRQIAALEIGARDRVGRVVHVHGEGREAVLLRVHERVHAVVLEEHRVVGLTVDGIGAAHRVGPALLVSLLVSEVLGADARSHLRDDG